MANPSDPVAMVALARLVRQTWAGRVADVQQGASFWARAADSAGLVAGGLARPWQAGDPALPASPEEPHTAHGLAGVASGTSNSSPGWTPPVPAGPPPRQQN